MKRFNTMALILGGLVSFGGLACQPQELKTFSINCKAATLADVPESSQPRCDEFSIQQAVNFWNDAAAKDGIPNAIFVYDQTNPTPDIQAIVDITPPASAALWIPIAKAQDSYSLAHSFGKKIGIPINANPSSIMNDGFESVPAETLQVTPEDLDAYLNLF